MPRYHYWFRISPRGIFGLSEPDKVLLPAGEINYTGPVIDSRTGNVMAPGTESVLRRLEDQVHVEVMIGDAAVTFVDDLLEITIEAANPVAAIGPVTEVVNPMLLVGTFGLGQLISIAFIQATDDNGVHVRFRSEHIDRWSVYDLAKVKQALGALPDQIARASADEAISNALQYFAKALALQPLIVTDTPSAIRPIGSPTAFVASEVYLNFWKVLETLLGGDPKSAAFRQRYVGLGLPVAEIDSDMVPIYGTRDAADVAHARRAQPPVTINDVVRVATAARRVLEATLAKGPR